MEIVYDGVACRLKVDVIPWESQHFRSKNRDTQALGILPHRRPQRLRIPNVFRRYFDQRQHAALLVYGRTRNLDG